MPSDDAELLSSFQPVELEQITTSKNKKITDFILVLFYIIIKLLPIIYFIACQLGFLVPFITYIVLIYLMIGDLYFTQAYFGPKLIGFGWEWKWSKIFSCPFVYNIDSSYTVNEFFRKTFWCGLALPIIFWLMTGLIICFSKFKDGLFFLSIASIHAFDFLSFLMAPNNLNRLNFKKFNIND